MIRLSGRPTYLGRGAQDCDYILYCTLLGIVTSINLISNMYFYLDKLYHWVGNRSVGESNVFFDQKYVFCTARTQPFRVVDMFLECDALRITEY